MFAINYSKSLKKDKVVWIGLCIYCATEVLNSDYIWMNDYTFTWMNITEWIYVYGFIVKWRICIMIDIIIIQINKFFNKILY